MTRSNNLLVIFCEPSVENPPAQICCPEGILSVLDAGRRWRGGRRGGGRGNTKSMNKGWVNKGGKAVVCFVGVLYTGSYVL